jgi:hypothetical protein
MKTLYLSVALLVFAAPCAAQCETPTVKKLNTVRYASCFPGADAGAKIANAIADLPTTGGTVVAGFEGTQTISSDPFSGVGMKPGVLLFSDATFNVSTTINVPSNWSIIGAYGGAKFGTGISGTSNGTVFKWTGRGSTETSISTIDRTSNVICVTTVAAHGLSPGDLVVITEVSDRSICGTFVVSTVPTSTTFTAPSHAPNVASISSSGKVVKPFNIFKIFDAHHVELRDLTIDGNSAAGSTGILLDSNNDPSRTHHVVIENVNLYRCLTGIQWGTGSQPDNPGYEVDKVQITNLHIESGLLGSTGIVVQGSNKGQDSKIRAVVTTKVDTGIDLSGGYAYLNIEDCSFGTPVSTSGDLDGIRSMGVAGLRVRGGSCESGTGVWAGHGVPGRHCFHNVSSDYNAGSAVTLIENMKVNEPIVLEGTSKFLTLGNYEPTHTVASTAADNATCSLAGLCRTTASTVTVTTASDHKLAKGDVVTISEAGDSTFNGTFTVASVTPPTTFTYAQNGTANNHSSGKWLQVMAYTTSSTYESVQSYGDYLNNGAGWANMGTTKLMQTTNSNLTTRPRSLYLGSRIVSGVNTATETGCPNYGAVSFDASLGNTQKTTLSCNVTTASLTNATAGQVIQFVVCQDGSGTWNFEQSDWDSGSNNVKGWTTVGTTASTCSAQTFIYDGSKAYAVATGKTNM